MLFICGVMYKNLCKNMYNKKVLLHECKRQTTHCKAVVSTCYWGDTQRLGTPQRWGTPLSKAGVPPIQGWDTPHSRLGYPLSKAGSGPPIQGWIGMPPPFKLDWVPPVQGWIGTPPSFKAGSGTPPLPSSKAGLGPPVSKAGLGTPPPKSEQTDISKYKYYLPS